MHQRETAPDLIDQVVIDTSWQTPRYIVVSRNQKYIQISAMAYGILEKVRAGHSFAAIAQTMSRERDANITEGETRLAYEHVLAKIHAIDDGAQTRQKNFWIKIPLLPAKQVMAITSRLTFLFHPVAVLIFLSSFVLLSVSAFERGLLTIHAPQTITGAILFYFLFLLSLMAHEFGHASACLLGGVKPSEIGFTIYLVFPAFYSNVSASWQLSRWKKVRVDVGGIYLQVCVGVIYLLLYLLFGLSAFQLAFLAILSSCAISLNPFARFDGYWIISDTLGITNLSHRPYELMIYWYNVIRHRPHKALPYSPVTTSIIATYGLLRSGIMIYFITAMSPFLWRAILNYPALLTSSLHHWQSGSLENLLADIQTLGGNSLLLVLWGMALIFISRPFFLQLVAGTQKTPNSQRQSQATFQRIRLNKRTILASALLLGIATMALTGFYSFGQYQSQKTVFDTTYPSVDNLPCQRSEQFSIHYHVHLSIYINEQVVSIPKVGIGSSCYYWLHVHDTSGIIHIEAPVDRPVTLGNFFHLWRARFSHLGTGMPAQLEDGSTWQVYVDGKPYHGDFQSIVFRAHLLITMGYRSPHMIPETIYNWNGN